MASIGACSRKCRTRALLAIFIFLSIMMTTLSAAATPENGPQQGSAVSKPEVAPPLACTGSFDWIQLRNGELLKGEIKELLYDKFTFESDELDTLELDLDDIYTVCSPRWNTVVLDDRTSVLGTLRIEGDAVIIATSSGERHYNREDLRSIIQGGVTETDYWSGKLSVGLTARSGNTDQCDVTSYLMLKRRTALVRTQFEYTSNYGSFEGTETINNQQAYLRHDIFVNDKVYMVAPSIQYYKDKFQNTAYRLTPGAGIGWQVFDRGDVQWNISVGAGYQYTRFSRVEPEEDSYADGGALLAGTNFDWGLTDRLNLSLDYRMTYGLSESINNTHHALFMFSIDMWKDLDFDISFIGIVSRILSPERTAVCRRRTIFV